MDITITHFIKALLLPPTVLLLLFFIAGVLHYFRHKLAKPMFIASFCLFYLFSIPLTSNLLMHALEIHPPLSAEQIEQHDRQAIIVLGSGKAIGPEYGNERTVTLRGLVRLRYAAKLHRDTGLPIVLTGGTVKAGEEIEADVMERVLKDEFKIDKIYKESQSRNTAQNAEYSAALLESHGLNKAYIVTQAWHMRRAMLVFNKYGIDAIAAPTAFEAREFEASIDYLIPNASSFQNTYFALHELIGYFWYLIRY